MDLNSPAIFSPCRTWRYTLHREWNLLIERSSDGDKLIQAPKVVFIGLNPSTADEVQDDPTVRRCIGFAKRWGYNGMFMLNIFGLRGMNPKVLYRATDPVGPENDYYIGQVITSADVTLVVACWGNHGVLRLRGFIVEELSYIEDVPLFRLGDLTQKDQPRHPLYLRGDLKPVKL